jgi:hypothetical protein
MNTFIGVRRDTLDAANPDGSSIEIVPGKQYDLNPEHEQVARAIRAGTITPAPAQTAQSPKPPRASRNTGGEE